MCGDRKRRTATAETGAVTRVSSAGRGWVMGAKRGTRSCSSSAVACTRGIGVEAPHHRVAEHGVGQRDQAHALVMGEEGLHDDAAGPGSGLAGALAVVGLAVRVVEGLVEAVRAVQPSRARRRKLLGGALGSTMAASAVA